MALARGLVFRLGEAGDGDRTDKSSYENHSLHAGLQVKRAKTLR
jgi:hypothetical protein